MRLIDGDALREKALPASKFYPEMLVVGLGCVFDAPTIDPAKHGRWIVTDHDQHCELCGFVVSKEGDFTDRQAVERFWRYCPNCGCRMDADD